jgi:hypothetical protein
MSWSLNDFDHLLSLNMVIWLFPLAFFLHDLEELLTLKRFPSIYSGWLPRFLRFTKNLNTMQVTIAITIEFLVILFASYLATQQVRQMDFFTTALAMFLVHAIGHAGVSIFLRRYTFGVGTAVLVALPYSLYAIYRLTQANLLSSANLISVLLIGTLLVGPFIFLVLFFGKLIGRFFVSEKEAR